MEKHVVVNNGLAGKTFQGGKGGNAQHGVSALGDFELTQGLATFGVVAQQGTYQELIDQPGIFADLAKRQIV